MSPSDRRSRRARPARRALVAGAALCGALLTGGCAGGPPAPPAAPGAPGGAAHGTHGAHGNGSPAPGKSASVEELASALGCAAEVSVEADELRQGACGSGQGAYRMTTFTAEEGLRAWLAETRVYGGVYLVGDRWVVTAQSEQALTGLRERLGGTLETGSEHTGH
ncbi:hypothetical protein [Streptomyces sp. NBC_00091]|uniref:hypothetical protein n=1 Tax=Streptomyces sp. NBC_00091 TaxID=2975648 RepID=UPI0022529974|nr:hypothetical protein [Streptomyces sp. NBC_00091]MCX5381580.1 hypothetical protein [Streptomyces sp. NBC_00091]